MDLWTIFHHKDVEQLYKMQGVPAEQLPCKPNE